MIPIVSPTDSVILDVLQGYLTRKYTRNDVLDWHKTMFGQYTEHQGGCSHVLTESKSGNFIVQSLSFIKDKGVGYEGPEEYFIRDEHFEEFILELKSIECEDRNGKIERHRNFEEISTREVDYPLIIISEGCQEVLQNFGIFFSRGVVDDLEEHVEYAFVTYENVRFYLHCRHYNDEQELIIYGFKGSDEALALMLSDVNVIYEQFSFVNEGVLMGLSSLYRLDDNGNEFLMAEFDLRIEALLCRRQYESLGHKQTYFLKHS